MAKSTKNDGPKPVVKDLIEQVRKRELTMYRVYDVEVELLSPLHGGVPQSLDVIEKWIEARIKKGALGKEAATRIKDEYAAEMQEQDEPSEAAADKARRERLCSFQVDDDGIYIEARQAKAMLKEAALTTGEQRNRRGSKQVWQTGTIVTAAGAKSIHGSDRIRFYNGDPAKHVLEPEGTKQSVVHAMTPQGPRTSIKLNDFVKEGRRLAFRIWTLELGKQTRAINDDYVTSVLANTQTGGLGANRSQGFGRFKVIGLKRESLPAEG